MVNNGLETVYRFNGVIYENKEDAEHAMRCDSIKRKVMTVLDVTRDTTFDEFWNVFIRNEKAIELTSSINI